MRLSEADVISGLAYPDVNVRQAMLDYFDGSFSRPIELTHAAISAVETWGLREALCWPHKLRGCRHNEESLDWCLDQITKLTESSESDRNAGHLARWAVEAPIDILRRQQDRMMAMKPFRVDAFGYERSPSIRLEERLAAWELTPQQCWDRAKQHCQSIGQINNFHEAGIAMAMAWLEPIAADTSAVFHQPILDTLGSIRENSPESEAWWGGLMIRLAGSLKIEDAFDSLMALFEIDWDWYQEEICRALEGFQTPEIHQRVIAAYGEQPWETRIFLSGPLENIHYQDAAKNVRDLLPVEDDPDLRVHLAVSLASHLDPVGIESAKAIYDEEPDDPERHAIIEKLHALVSVADLDVPDRQTWADRVQRDWETSRDSISEIFERWKDRASRSEDFASREDRIDSPVEPAAPTAKQRPGRNEACPCGSGKKYKKCCLTKAFEPLFDKNTL